MRKKIVLLLLIVFSQGLFCDWKTRINDYFLKIKDNEGAIQYLTKIYDIQKDDRKTICIILAYLYDKIKNKENERLWIDQYFDPYTEEDIQFEFLNDITNIEISDYVNKWKSNYPIIKAIKLTAPEVSTFATRPHFIDLAIEMENKSHFKITNGSEILGSGMLNRGKNLIRIREADPITFLGKHFFSLELKIGSVLITKGMVLTITADTPPDILIEDGKLRFKDKDFRDEHPFQDFTEKERYFDKNHFLSRSLPLMGAGLGLFAGNQLILFDRIDSNNFTREQAPLLHGAHYTAQVISVGLVVKGTINLFKSFKTKITQTKRRVYSPSAAGYNQVLKEALVNAESEVKILITLEIKK